MGGRRRSIWLFLSAEAVSLTGTRLAMIALPWYVLVTTDSAALTGVIAFANLGPYVLAKALGGPLIDRIGAQRVSFRSDVISTLLVGCIPLADAVGALSIVLLVGLVAVAGAVGGPGDGAKSALVPQVAETAGASMEQVAGLRATVERLASSLGPALAGALVLWVGPATALVVNAGSFGVAAGLIGRLRLVRGDGVTTDTHVVDERHYLGRIREGFDFLRREPLLRVLAGIVAVTNLLDAARFTVLLPLWAKNSGFGPAALGLVSSAMSGAAVAGSLVATVMAERLPRRTVFFVCFLTAGAPPFVVLALGVPLWAVVATYVLAGVSSGFLNPILSAVTLERIPRHLLGRVVSLTSAISWAGMPLGGMAAGALVTVVGFAPTLLAGGVIYVLATTLPVLGRACRDMDRRRAVDGGVIASTAPSG